jgi:lysophospholipid acyltransferase (LPLAT)-like uncharacterized protein
VRRLALYLAFAYVRLLQLTTRVRYVRQELRDALRRADRRFIYAFWHQRQVFFAISHPGDKLAVLISRSKDGDLIAAVVNFVGVDAVRGSSSRGGVAAAKEMIDVLR